MFPPKQTISGNGCPIPGILLPAARFVKRFPPGRTGCKAEAGRPRRRFARLPPWRIFFDFVGPEERQAEKKEGSIITRVYPAFFILLTSLCLLPQIPAALALFAGAALGMTFGNPFGARTRALTRKLLALSIVGLGAGMDLEVVARVGAQGFLVTLIGIVLTLAAGHFLGRLLRCPSGVSALLGVGTAICGGSAIAAVAPVIRAKDEEVSVALATVFLLNATALLLFPWIGHALGLSQGQFGLWSALAIHDTSSVVGASLQYGPQALQIGTTVKLARALWIIPVTLFFGWLIQSRAGEAYGDGKRSWHQALASSPGFIWGFILTAALVTYVPPLQPLGHAVEAVARRTLVLALFLIGSGLTRGSLRELGPRPLLQGGLLWAMVLLATLGAIRWQWVSLH